jgi:hypothetical protein
MRFVVTKVKFYSNSLTGSVYMQIGHDPSDNSIRIKKESTTVFRNPHKNTEFVSGCGFILVKNYTQNILMKMNKI